MPDDVALADVDAERCAFVGVDLTEASIRGARLSECRFERCEMTLADVTDVTLHDVTFDACRLQAVDFGALARDPIGIGATFIACDLSLAVFRGLDLRGVAFDGGRATEAMFIEADLRGVALRGPDLSGAEFRACDLREADLRDAVGFVSSPCTNRVRGMRIDLVGATGLLSAVAVRWD